MKARRNLVFLVLILLVFTSSINFASADPFDEVADAIVDIGKGIYEVLEVPLEGLTGERASSEFFLAKVLFLLIIFSLVYVVLDKMPFFKDQNWSRWIVPS